MTTSEWYYNFLEKRSLASPDGRPLYRYKTSDSEFRQLQSLLTIYPVSNDTYKRWDACFALYAAEWWRRNYSEGHWSWDPILLSIQKSIDQAYQRGHLVESGFRCWKRKIYKTSKNHNDFLATVIIECGLPLQTLASERRYWLKDVIKESYADLSLISASESDPNEIVEQVAVQLLPNSLKKQSFYELIAQLIMEAIDLKGKFKLAEQQSPIGFLDQHKPNWRDSFPIQIDQVGKEFLDELLGEVVQMREPKNYRIALVRELVKVHERWVIKSTLSIPKEFYDEEDLVLPQDKIDSLPSKLDVELMSPTEEGKRVGVAYKTQKNGSSGYKIGISYTLGADQSYKKLSLFLVNQEEQFTHELPLPGGESLEKEQPWIFTEKDGVWQLKAMASYRTRSAAVKIVADRNWAKTGDFEVVDTFDDTKGIYLLKGEGVIIAEDQKFRIVTGSDKTDNTTYMLQGSTFRYSTRNNELYLGFPCLYKVNNTTLVKSRAYQKIEIKKPGHDNWQKSTEESIGAMKVRVLGEGGEVIYSGRICVLPENFDVSLKTINPIHGKVTLLGSSAFNINLLGEEIESEMCRTSDGHEISLHSLLHLPPKYFLLSMVDSDSSRITVEVPFPFSGAKFFDGSGRQLPNGSKHYLDKLHGLRLVLFNPSSTQRTYSLGFELENNNFGDNIKLVKAVKVDSYHREIPMITYSDIINRLFAVSEGLDAQIRIGIEKGPQIIVRIYSSKSFVNEDEETITLNGAPEALQQSTINTFRLDENLAKQEIEVLEAIDNGSQHEGKWHFNINSRPSGRWLIYPAADSAIMFRPVCWSIQHEETDSGYHVYDSNLGQLESIKESASIRDKEERIDALGDLVERMSEDFGNHNWKEMTLLWKNAHHLPLSTFDVWTAFSKCEEALIALYLHLGEGILERFSEEYPILIEAFPVDKWISVLQKYFNRLSQLIPEFAESAVENRLQYLKDHFNLYCLVKVLRSEVLRKAENELAIGQQAAIIKDMIYDMFNGSLGYQGLNQRNMNNQWPDYLTKQITESFRALPAEARHLIPEDIPKYKRCVTYLPLLLAAATTGGGSIAFSKNDIVSIFRIKETQDFDRDWFSDAFDLLLCYYWMNHKNIYANA